MGGGQIKFIVTQSEYVDPSVKVKKKLYNPALEFCLQAKALKQKLFEKQIFAMVITNKYLYIISRQGFIRQAKNSLIYGISCIDEAKNEVSRRGSKF